ncbi:MAG TPA: hypothetical protein VFW69_05250 [Mycobacterium sp.]|nr:hypothetical protein [Mycobacterium sp.]
MMGWFRGLIVLILVVCFGLHGVPVAHANYGGYGDCDPGVPLPGHDATEMARPDEMHTYDYDPLSQDVRNAEEPSPDQLERISVNNAVRGNADTLKGMQARWKKYVNAGGSKPWEKWKPAYINVLQNRRVGPAFEKFMFDSWKLGDLPPEAGWQTNKQLPKNILPSGPVFDIFNIADSVPVSKWLMIEAKSGTTLGAHARNQFADHVKRMGQLGSSLMVMFAGRPTDATQRWMKQTIDDLRAAGVKMPPAFCARYTPAKPQERKDPGSAAGNSAPRPAPDPVLDESADSPEDQALEDQIASGLEAEDNPTEEPAPGQPPTNAPIPAGANPAPAPQAPAPAPQAPAPAPQAPAPAPQAPAPAPQAPLPAQPRLPAPALPAPQLPAPPRLPAPALPAPQLPAAPRLPAPALPAPPRLPAPALPAPAVPAPPRLPAPALPAPALPAPALPAPGVPAPSVPAPTVGVPVSASPGPFGGIDFTSLEMRYVTDSVNGKPAMQYAFSANTLPVTEASYGGRRNAKMAMDAFYVWLSLPPQNFWVNLKPTEPDRIIEAAFGRTEAGEVLLEADLEMKLVSARLQKTDTDLGRRFVDAMQGNKCYLGRRLWIVPQPAEVHEDGDQLYILDTPLTVKIGTDQSDVTPGTDLCQDQDPAVTDHNGQLYQQMIMPALIDAVNHNPDFADLRRVYTSRVAAEWYRKRNANKPTQYAKLIDSGNIDDLTVAWDPRAVWERYLDSTKHPEPTFSWTDPKGTTWTRSWGGVDFSKVETHDIGAPEFTQKYASVAKTAGPSIIGPLVQDNAKQVWLGNVVSSVPLDQIWPSKLSPWVPFVAPATAPSKPLFYLVILPAVAWLGGGGYLLWRRRANGVR